MASQVTMNFTVPTRWKKELVEAGLYVPETIGRRYPRSGMLDIAGFRIDKLVAEVMRELDIRYPVEVYFDEHRTAYASATRPFGQAEVHLPTRQTIKRHMPWLTPREIQAKQIAEVCEELQHLRVHETEHPKKVTGPTIRCIIRHVPKRDLRSASMKDKIAVLKEAD